MTTPKEMTYNELILSHMQNMSPERLKELKERSKLFADEIKKMSPEDGGIYMQAVIEIIINSVKKLDKFPKLTCKKGCNYCCYQLVGVSENEIALIVKRHKFTDEQKQKIKRLAHVQTVKEYNQLPYEERRCVFATEDDLCAIYDMRPIACRLCLSITDPKLCDCRDPQPRESFIITAADVPFVLLSAELNNTGYFYDLLNKKLNLNTEEKQGN